ncbi:MAG: uracil-DNA glycosylase [Ruminococcaceae bacterium]|nr:uracil-DNA glycosylase [Oscillospiraceae bacterium]
MLQIGNSWDTVLADEVKKPYFADLMQKVSKEYEKATVYPPKENIYNALRLTPYEKVKILLLGQDPYHGEGQAHGLAFSVLPGVPCPPSLQNMFKELQSDLGIPVSTNGCLTAWGEQGVLLLNTVLTVREGEPNSHKNLGWTTFTDAVIRSLNDREDPVIFLLWGANAKEKLPLITNSRHYVLSAPHPSPLSAHRGFFGCKHFSKCNLILQRQNKAPINWQLSF